MISKAISALLLGKSIASLIVPRIISFFVLNLFTGSVPSLTAEISAHKTYDLLEFAVSLFLSILVFSILYLYHIKVKSRKITDWFLLAFSFLFWFQTIFSVFSGKSLVIFLSSVIAIYIFATNWLEDIKKIKIDLVVIANGIFLGFWLLLVANFQKGLPVLGPALLVLTPIIYLLLWQKGVLFIRRRLNVLFAFGVLFVIRLDLLLVLGGVTALALLLEKKFIDFEKSNYLWNHIIYPAFIIFVFAFNPLFFVGKFDFIEEGFWLGWIARISDGQVLYRDVVVYHGPGLVVLMGKFMSFFSYSFESFRLFFEIIKITGLVFLFYLADQLLKNKINKIFLIVIIASISETLVKNNVEFRLGLGALGIVLWWTYLKKKNLWYLFFSGSVIFIGLITSLEVGIAGLIAVTSATLIQKKDRVKKITALLGGLSFLALPFIIFNLVKGSLQPMVDQLVFYAKAFSSGYFNSAMVRPPESAHLHWSLLIDYFGSEAFSWDLSFMILAGGIMFLFVKFARFKKLENEEKLLGVLLIFTLALARSSLGRSDWYHLLFVLIPSLIILFYLVEKWKIKNINLFVLLLLSLLVFKNEVNQRFLSRLFFNWQNYGRVGSDYKAFFVGSEKVWTLDEESAGIREIGSLLDYIKINIPDKEIFTYPWMPELYYFSGLKNPTIMDTPYAFYDSKYQSLVIDSLAENKPLIIYNPLRSFGGLDEKSLPELTGFIKENYIMVTEVGSNKILKYRL